MIEAARIIGVLRLAIVGVALFLLAASETHALEFGSGSLPIAF